MLNYLKIFSWLLLSFGLVGFLAVALGFATGIGSASAAIGIMGIQTVVGSVILYGFKLNSTGKIDKNLLLYGGWALVVLLIIIGQVWANSSDINI